jgi:hypothetical protein
VKEFYYTKVTFWVQIVYVSSQFLIPFGISARNIAVVLRVGPTRPNAAIAGIQTPASSVPSLIVQQSLSSDGWRENDHSWIWLHKSVIQSKIDEWYKSRV